MNKLDGYYCPNKDCELFGITGEGNISIRGKYGKNKDRLILYCRTCGKRFSASQSSSMIGLHISTETIQKIISMTAKGDSVRIIARRLKIDKDTVNRVLLRADEQCYLILSDLLKSLELSKTNLNELFNFVKKRKISKRLKESLENSANQAR